MVFDNDLIVVQLTSLCWIGNRTNLELSGVSSGSGRSKPADSFLLKSEMSMVASSLSIVVRRKSTSGIDSKEMFRVSSMVQLISESARNHC